MPTITTITALGVFVDGSQPINYQPTAQTKHVARGADTKVRCTVRNSAGSLVNLTSCACTLSVKQFEDSPTTLIARLGTVVDALNGIVDFELSADDSIGIGVGAFVYDVMLVAGDGLRAQIVPISNFFVDASALDPTRTPTVPLPSMQGQANKLLGTDGTVLEWVNVDGTFNPRGAWASGLAWAVNDITTDAGSTFRCKLAINPSNTAPGSDPTHFELWAEAGAEGDKGDKGDTGDTGPQGPAGPAPSGGSDGDLVVRVSGVAAWVSPGSAFLNAIVRMLSATLPSGGAWQTLGRITPGANKIGMLLLSARGRTNTPSVASIWDQLGFMTLANGRVFLQSNALAPIGGTTPTFSGTGSPDAPTNLADVPGSGTETITFDLGGNEVNGCFLQVSTDAGATWTTVALALGRPSSLTATIDNDRVPGNTAVKFRVVAFNQITQIASAALDVTTGNPSMSGGDNGSLPAAPYYPIRQAQYDDTRPYWFHLDGQVSGGGGDMDLVLVPDANGGSVETDILIMARAKNGQSGAIGVRIDITTGPTL